MRILFTGRRAHLSPALKTFAEERLTKLQKVLDGILDVHVIVKLERHRHVAEFVVKSRSATLTAKAEAGDSRDAIIQCVDRLLSQAKKHHGRLRMRRKRVGTSRSSRRSAVALALAGQDGSASRDLAIVRMGRVPAKPMSVEEAFLQVRASRDPLVLFLNEESQQLAVLFRRPDGRFGLVEAES